MLRLTQYYLNTIRPEFLGWLTRVLYSGKGIDIHSSFRCDAIPKIQIDKKCQIKIDKKVFFRRNVELRAHQKATIKIGNNVRVDRSVRVLATNESKIEIGNGARIGLNSVLNGGSDIKIGSKSLISGFVYLQTSMHNYKLDSNISDQGFRHEPIHLENDVWLGTHVVVMPGITIKQGTVVGSTAVVTKNFDKENLILGGIPANIINERK